MSDKHTPKESSYTDSVSDSFSTIKDSVTDISSNASQKQAAIDANENATAEQKALASKLNIAEAGVNALGTAMGLSQRASEAVMMPLMKAMGGFRGMACLSVSKMFDPVMGVDVHMVNSVPPGTPVPMPHPYIGFMFSAKDLLSCTALTIASNFVPPAEQAIDENSSSEEIAAANTAKAENLAFQMGTMAAGCMGASVKVGKFHPKTSAGTPSKPVPHFPMGPGFHPGFSAAVDKNKGHALLGSLTVVADQSPLNGGSVQMHNDCWDTGVFSIHNTRPNKNAEDLPAAPTHLYVPSGTILPIPLKGIILTNPIPAPFNPLTLARKLFKGGFGKLRNSKLGRKAGEKLINLAKKIPGLNKLGCPFWTEQSRKYGTHKSHPVDVSTGHFFTDNTDWTLGGINPLAFERVYYSHSPYHLRSGTCR